MSINHDYRQTNGSAAYNDDHDSDLDLGLDELDPQTPSTSSTPNHKHSRSKASTDFGKNIPLKNLRLGGRRGYRRALTDAYRDADDLEALVGDTEEAEPPSTSTTTLRREDGAGPLLRRSSAGLRTLSHQSQTAFAGFKARLLHPLTSLTSTAPAPQDIDDEEHDPSTNRLISVGQRQLARYPPNAVSNAKYTPLSFLPRTLYNEFSFFFNMYFLLVAMSQIIPALRIGYLSTYIAPLAFVLCITLGKEAMDDVARRRRDQEANSERYQVLEFEHNARPQSRQPAKGKEKAKGLKKLRKTRPKDEYQEQDVDDSLDAISHTTVREVSKSSRDLKVGDVLVMTKDRRFPADVVILKSFSLESATAAEDSAESEHIADRAALHDPDSALIDTDIDVPVVPSAPLVNDTTSQDPSAGGEAFIRTDQLDGETDWKLRLASPLTQDLATDDFTRLRLTAGKPDRKVNEFAGTLELLPSNQAMYDPYIDKSAADAEPEPEQPSKSNSIPLSIDNTAWANTVLASSSTVFAVVLYTGPQTRAAMSTSASRSKTGLLENEINSLVKILCFLTLALSFILVAGEGFESKNGQKWYVAVMRFLILFSTIVPISLRVNLDMGKSVYAWFIQRDQGIPETVVRTSTIPEDLGRIEYLLSDKTGTLTQNGSLLMTFELATDTNYRNRDGAKENSRRNRVVRQRSHGRGLVVCSLGFR